MLPGLCVSRDSQILTGYKIIISFTLFCVNHYWFLLSFIIDVKFCKLYLKCYTVTPVYSGHPWDPKKAAVVQKLRHIWPLFTVYHCKILEKWGSSWPLQTGGHCSEVAVNTGLTVLSKFKSIQSIRVAIYLSFLKCYVQLIFKTFKNCRKKFKN